MAFLDDEPKAKPEKLGTKPLDDLSVDELQDYIGDLTSEIERVKAMIARKQDHKAAVSGLFKS
ncbi:MAG: DUF1192 domain-containing protein [Pseudomonadota bacterium]